MNCNMTYREKAGLILLAMLVLLAPLHARAGESKNLPASDILIVYSDGADDGDMENVGSLIEILTYMDYQVSFAAASDCSGNMTRFSNVIFYDVEVHPPKFYQEVRILEKNGSALLFIGSSFLKEYLDQTQRSNTYVFYDLSVGRLYYEPEHDSGKQSLIRSDGFLFLNEEGDYCTGRVEVDKMEGYFCKRKGNLTHISVNDVGDPLVNVAIAGEIAKWIKPAENERNVYAQYMVINSVYPFQSPEKLLQVVEEFVIMKEPFVISVMPIYEHGDYPAMQQFCEVLRYAQGNGGVILLHSPICQTKEFDADLVNERIKVSMNYYLQQGVYPMGLQVPESWMFDPDKVEVMSRFTTILVSDEEDGYVRNLVRQENNNQAYQNKHQWIAPGVPLDAEGASYIDAYSMAVYFDMTEDLDVIKSRIEACRSSHVPLKSLWDAQHSFWTEEDTMIYENQMILVNGQRVDKTYVPLEQEEAFSYRRNMLQRFSRDLTEENRKLLLAVIAVAGLFLLFIFMARHQNRERFFYRDEEEDMDEYWKNKG